MKKNILLILAFGLFFSVLISSNVCEATRVNKIGKGRLKNVISAYAFMQSAPNKYESDIKKIKYKEKRFDKDFLFYGFIYQRIPLLHCYVGVEYEPVSNYDDSWENVGLLYVSNKKKSGYKYVSVSNDILGAGKSARSLTISADDEYGLKKISFEKGETVYYKLQQTKKKFLIIPYKIPAELSKPVIDAYRDGDKMYFAYVAEGKYCETQYRYKKSDKWKKITRLTGKLEPLVTVNYTSRDFYVRCRTWEKINGKKVYSDWSEETKITPTLDDKYYKPDMNSTTDDIVEGKPKLDKSEVSIKEGKSVIIKMKGTSTPVKWYVSLGDELISIKSMNRNSVEVLGEMTGVAQVVGMVGKEKFLCSITVEGGSVELLNSSDKNTDDVERLRAFLQEQHDRGADIGVNVDLNKSNFEWTNGCLTTLNLYNVGLNGEIEISGFNKLEALFLQSSDLLDFMMKNTITTLKIENCNNLSRVICYGNMLNSILMHRIGDLSVLVLDNNCFKNDLDFSEYPNLRILSLFNSGLSKIDVSKNNFLKLLFTDDHTEITGLLSSTNNENITFETYMFRNPEAVTN